MLFNLSVFADHRNGIKYSPIHLKVVSKELTGCHDQSALICSPVSNYSNVCLIGEIFDDTEYKKKISQNVKCQRVKFDAESLVQYCMKVPTFLPTIKRLESN